MTTKTYTFDFSKSVTIADFHVIGRMQREDYSPELLQEFYEVIDKFLDEDLFALDIKEVQNVVSQFALALNEHLDTK